MKTVTCHSARRHTSDTVIDVVSNACVYMYIGEGKVAILVRHSLDIEKCSRCTKILSFNKVFNSLSLCFVYLVTSWCCFTNHFRCLYILIYLYRFYCMSTKLDLTSILMRHTIIISYLYVDQKRYVLRSPWHWPLLSMTVLDQLKGIFRGFAIPMKCTNIIQYLFVD